MKISPQLLAAFCVLASLTSRGEEPRPSGKGPEVLPSGLQAPASEVTNDEAFRALRNASGATMPKPVPKQAKSYGIAELSVFFSHSGDPAILPKGSVIFCPDSLAGRVSNRAVGKPVAWPEFLVANRNWISTHEVTLAQVRGGL